METRVLQPGDDVEGRYRILRRLGVGGMGTVYVAEQYSLGREVALKVLHTDYASDPSLMKRFQREAKAASSVRHRNVVTIFDAGRIGTGELYYTMEYLEGRDLAQLLQEVGLLPWERAGWIVVQIVRALAAIHRQGILHRDIKPSNCFLLAPKPGEELDCIKVIDFGIAKTWRDTQGGTQLTQAGEFIGSPAYVSPDRIMDEEHRDVRSDVYSTGILIYELVTGTVPFQGQGLLDVLRQHYLEAPPRPRERRPDLPEAVEAIILKALAKRPEDRFQAMEDLEQALLPTLEGVPTAWPALPIHAHGPYTREHDVVQAGHVSTKDGLATLHIRARHKLGVAGIAGWSVAALALAGMGWMSTTRSRSELPVASATVIPDLPPSSADRVLVVPMPLPPEEAAAVPGEAVAVHEEPAAAALAGPGAASEEAVAAPEEPAPNPAPTDAPSTASSPATEDDDAPTRPRRRPPADEPTSSRGTDEAVRKLLRNRLKACGASGGIEVRAEYILESGRLFKPSLVTFGEATSDPAVRACATKVLQELAFRPRNDVAAFDPLIVKF